MDGMDGPGSLLRTQEPMMYESLAMASLCPMFPEGPTVAMQRAEDRSLLAHALLNAPEWRGARSPADDGALRAVVGVTAGIPMAMRVIASGRYCQ